MRDTRELLLERLDMIRVYVSIAESVDEFTSFQPANLRQHAG